MYNKNIIQSFFFIYKDILTRIQKQIKKEFKWILIDFFLFLEGKKVSFSYRDLNIK